MQMRSQIGGILDVITKASSLFNTAGGKVIESATQYQAIKNALNPPISVPTAASVQQQATGERFVPGTTLIAAPERALTKSEIAEVQTQLNARGFNSGKVDGIFGPKTSAGIKAFQSAYGLPQTGALSMALYQQLTGKSAATAATPAVQSTSGATGFPPYSTPIIIQTPAPVSASSSGGGFMSNLPSWALPVGLGAMGLIAILAMSGGASSTRRR